MNTTPRGVKSHVVAEIDVIKEIHRIQKEGINIAPQWIKSHQDDSSNYEDLCIPAQLNCDADKCA
eukprot:4163565-Ditylum_brightwellii.AAC.1